MLAQFCLVALLLAPASQAFPTLLAAHTTQHIPANTPSITLDVVFGECVDDFEASDITVAAPSGVSWTATPCTGSGQTYQCVFTASGQNANVWTTNFRIAGNAVVAADNQSSNFGSNEVSAIVYPAFEHILRAEPDVEELTGDRAEFKYYSTSHQSIHFTYMEEYLGMEICQGGSCDYDSLEITDEMITFGRAIGNATFGAVTATVPAQIMQDLAGHYNEAASITKQVAAPSCDIGEWSAWGDCSATCDGGYDNEFNEVLRVRSRTRTVIPSGCDQEEEVGQCEGGQIYCIQGSRPRSGEYLSQNICMENAVALAGIGCSCDQDCWVDGSCCQKLWNIGTGENICGTLSPDDVPECLESKAKHQATWFVEDFITCSEGAPVEEPMANCASDSAISDPAHPSYFCWCDFQCTRDFSCCNGEDSRSSICEMSGSNRHHWSNNHQRLG